MHMIYSFVVMIWHVQETVQYDVDAIQAWFYQLQLINISKSPVMLIGSQQRLKHHNVSIHISGIGTFLRY